MSAVPNTPSNLFPINPIPAPALVLTDGQQAALDAFVGFLMDPVETVFVLEGYAGCGKSTLVKTLLERLPDFMQTAKLINPKMLDYETMLTATTNKAAEALMGIVKQSVITIHSALGLRVQTDFKTGATTLIPRAQTPLEGKLLFIDEASYIDGDLLTWVSTRTKNCKIVFIGDPAQLTPVKSTTTPVFEAGFTGAKLTEVVRQAKGNPIIDLATAFRETVNTGEFFSFTPDGHHIQYMNEDDFNAALMQEFNRPDWKYSHSKVLAWTNKAVNGYNHFIRENVKGEPQLQEDDYAICNNFVQLGTGRSVKTDQLVQITRDHGQYVSLGVPGRELTIDGANTVFLPDDLSQYKKRLKQAQAEESFADIRTHQGFWIDLRAAFACTINKSQGSTFDKVFIDLDDIRRCNSGDQIARMLYVAVSRARDQVIFTGDIAG